MKMVKLLAQIWSRCVCEVKWWLLVRAKMDENEGADSWLRYYSENGDDGRLRCCHEMVRMWQSCGVHGG